MRAKSIFQTATFQHSAIALFGGLAPIIISCIYQRRHPTQNEAIATVALITTFFTALVGRVQTSPVYTPDDLPGPDKKDFN